MNAPSGAVVAFSVNGNSNLGFGIIEIHHTSCMNLLACFVSLFKLARLCSCNYMKKSMRNLFCNNNIFNFSLFVSLGRKKAVGLEEQE